MEAHPLTPRTSSPTNGSLDDGPAIAGKLEGAGDVDLGDLEVLSSSSNCIDLFAGSFAPGSLWIESSACNISQEGLIPLGVVEAPLVDIVLCD